MDFCVCISSFLLVDNAMTWFNYFFRDFRGFRDFCDLRGFDLAVEFLRKSFFIFKYKENLFLNNSLRFCKWPRYVRLYLYLHYSTYEINIILFFRSTQRRCSAEQVFSRSRINHIKPLKNTCERLYFYWRYTLTPCGFPRNWTP